MINNSKKNKGITLIALVITIIVLLILAGISINIILGNDGIISRSKDAHKKTQEEAYVEEVKLKLVDYVIGESVTPTGDYIEDTIEGFEYIDSSENDKGYYELFRYKEREVKIYFDENYKITDVELVEQIVKNVGDLDIYTCEEMFEFAERVNNGENFSGCTVRLKNNLDFEGAEWDAIGYSPLRANGDHADAYFAGTFDGEEHYISGLTITDERYEAGIFGYNKGTIKNLAVQLTVTKSSSYILYAAGIVGYNEGNIENCFTDVEISCVSNSTSYDARVGSIAGSNYGTITNSGAYGIIKTEGKLVNMGGISGDNNGTIQKCMNGSTVIINENYRSEMNYTGAAGGIVGENRGTVYQCKNTGEVAGSNLYIAGIVGENLSSAEINECVNTGNLSSLYKNSSGGSNAPYIAGICSCNRWATIKNSYNKGNIIIDPTYAGKCSGVVGFDQDGIEISNCYSVGEISGGGSNCQKYAVACLSSSVNNCYYDSVTSIATDSYATPKTTTEFKSDDMINNLGSAYKKNPDGGYPLLNWE